MSMRLMWSEVLMSVFQGMSLESYKDYQLGAFGWRDMSQFN
jgi:hypothetical protein